MPLHYQIIIAVVMILFVCGVGNAVLHIKEFLVDKLLK